MIYRLTETGLVVPWPETEKILGRPYEPTLDDDEALRAAVIQAGGPPWASFAGGATLEEGWYLEAPKSALKSPPYSPRPIALHVGQGFAEWCYPGPPTDPPKTPYR